MIYTQISKNHQTTYHQGGWKLFLIGELCLGWCLELFGWRNFVVWWRFEWDMKVWRFVVMEVLESGLRD